MNRLETLNEYERRINCVMIYIHDHLDDELDMDKLAEIACFSPYHWHRIYRALTGETAAQTVRRLRLHRAAGELSRDQDNLIGIAKRAGYGSIAAFNRAFRKSYGLPPAAYRARSLQRFKINLPNEEDYKMYDVSIHSYEQLRVVAMHHVGPYTEIGKAFEQLNVWANSKGIMNDDTRAFGIYYDDPTATEESKLRSDAAFIVDDEFESDDNRFHTTRIESGRYAVLTFKGPYSELERAYTWFYGTWLPAIGEEAAHKPLVEEYLNDVRETKPSELLTNICLPLA